MFLKFLCNENVNNNKYTELGLWSVLDSYIGGHGIKPWSNQITFVELLCLGQKAI
jgi:hypothetical protein